MRDALGLGSFLALLWLLLSGHFSPLLLSLGLLSVVLVVLIGRRMGLVDAETLPILVRRQSLRYGLWLAWQVIRANWAVARLILSRRLVLDPVCIPVPAPQRTRLGRVTFANSITLTPGTVSVDLQGNTILVHALRREWAESLPGGELEQRVRAWEESL